MSNGQLSIINDHDSSNRLSDARSSQHIKLKLQYNDRWEDLEKHTKAQFLPTATIRDVIKEFLKLVHLEHIRPEDVNLVDITYDRRYHVPVENAHMTLSDLNIVDGCTLCFGPSLTSVPEEPSYLTIWAPNSVERVEYKWYKTSATLGMLLEHVIHIFSLELIERERVHLFYDHDELDLALNYDKLLKELRIRDNAYIDVEIIPSISYPISFANNSTSVGHLSSLNGQNSTAHLSYSELSQQIELELQYTDRKQDLKKNVKVRFLPTTTIRDVIKEFLKLVHLEHIRPEDVTLVDFSLDKRYMVPLDNANKTLRQLTIVNGCTLYFEPSSTSASIKPCYLTVKTLDGIKRVEYEWYKTTTTLSMLLEHVIKDFSLQSIERKYIRLTTLFDKKLDHISNPNSLLSDLYITNHDWIYVAIVQSYSSSTANGDLNVHVECASSDKTQVLDVPYTTTIEELKNQIEKRYKDYLLLDFKLFDRMHEKIDLSNPNHTLYHLGIQPGQTIYASLRLAFRGNQSSTLNIGSDTMTRFSSIVAKHPPDEVAVIYEFSMLESVEIKASVNDTVAELIKKLETVTKSRPLAQFQMWSGSIYIDNEQPSRLLSDFGIKSGDTIKVKMTEKTLARYSNDSSRFTTSYTLGGLSRTQRFDSTPVGLANLGNTCYMNSALQCLAHAKPLTQFVLDGLTQGASDDDKCIDTEWNQFYTIGTVTGAYADVLRNLWIPNKTNYYSLSFRPDHIKETIGLKAPRFATLDQQDVQEFMTFLLDEVHKELKEKNGCESSTIIEELFFGKIQSTITCLECKHEVKTTNPISFLPLPLSQQGRMFKVTFIGKNGENDVTNVSVPENGQVKSIIQAFVESRPSYHFFRTIIAMTDDGPLDLEMPLNKLFITEVILVEQDDFTSSSQFNRFDRHSKRLTLEGCLREFCSLERLEDSWLCQQETCKKHTKASKQLQLCSLPPILIIQFKRFSHEDGLREKIETFVDYPIEGLDLSSFLPSSEEAIYDLFAVSNHIGSIYGGHYTAYARHEKNGTSEWYKFDDSFVSRVYYKDDIVSRDAYLLFYIKRDQSKPSTAVTTS